MFVFVCLSWPCCAYDFHVNSMPTISNSFKKRKCMNCHIIHNIELSLFVCKEFYTLEKTEKNYLEIRLESNKTSRQREIIILSLSDSKLSLSWKLL